MTNAVSLAQQASTGVSQGFKNRIINGAMVIDQRNAGASVTPANGDYTLDRWKFSVSQTSKLTVAQSSTAPAGFTNSMLVTSSSAYSIISTDYFVFSQKVEGFNSADLNWGTANAKTITISFWVRSSITGTYSVSVLNAANNRSYPVSYTISAANTWEYKSVTIPGDTTGTWVGATNGIGLDIYWNLGTGSTYSGTSGAWAATNYYATTGATSLVGTNGATFYITGVQLEVGSTATSFDTRPYGTELMLCQRYYSLVDTASGGANNSGGIQMAITFPVEMRSTPTVSMTSARISNLTSSDYTSSSPAPYFQNSNNRGGRLQIDGWGGLTTGIPYILIPSGPSASPAKFTAEL